MQIHRLLSFLILVTANCIYAQVGINTTSPQEALHVAGDITSNIKIEGLNTTNNVNNLGIGNSTRVYVNGEGDLTLASSQQKRLYKFQQEGARSQYLYYDTLYFHPHLHWNYYNIDRLILSTH